MWTGSGYSVNINELGGIHAAVLCGVTNTIATIPGIVAPYIVGVMTAGRQQSEWQIVFILSSFIYAFGGFVFVLFGRSEPFYLDRKQQELFGLVGPAANLHIK